MKKIVALVLSLVMALSLCTVAFAADPLFDKDGDEIPNFNVEVEKVEAKYDADRTDLPFAGNLEYYAGDNGCGYKVVTDKKDAEYSISVGKTVIYLALIEDSGLGSVGYNYKGQNANKVYVWDCKEGLHEAGYKFTDEDGNIVLTKKCDAAAAEYYLLVGTEIIPVREMTSDEWIAGGHALYQVSKDAVRPNVYSFKCAGCGTEFYGSYSTNFGPDGAVFYDANYAAHLTSSLDAGGKFGWDALQKLPAYTKLVNENLYIWTKDADAGKTPATGVNSPKTFDAGIAMYVGMSLLSVAGGAVVIGKKKEF